MNMSVNGQIRELIAEVRRSIYLINSHGEELSEGQQLILDETRAFRDKLNWLLAKHRMASNIEVTGYAYKMNSTISTPEGDEIVEIPSNSALIAALTEGGK